MVEVNDIFCAPCVWSKLGDCSPVAHIFAVRRAQPMSQKHQKCGSCCTQAVVPLTFDVENNIEVTVVDGETTLKNKGINGAATIILVNPFTCPTTFFSVKPSFSTTQHLVLSRTCNQQVMASIGAPPPNTNKILAWEQNQGTEGHLVVLLENTDAEQFIDDSSDAVRTYISHSPRTVDTKVQLGFGVPGVAFSTNKLHFGKHLRFFADIGDQGLFAPGNFVSNANVIAQFVLNWPTMDDDDDDNVEVGGGECD